MCRDGALGSIFLFSGAQSEISTFLHLVMVAFLSTAAAAARDDRR